MEDAAVVVVGSANMDMVVSCDRFPNDGETVLAGEFGMYPGGKGANQATACAKLGARVRFLTKMGQDVFRERLLDSLGANGIDLTYVLVDDDAPTGVALITVDKDGENQIIVVSGSNMRLAPKDVRENSDAFVDAKVVALQLEIPLETVIEAARAAKAAGARVILNPAPARELPEELLREIDYLTPNESEAALLSGVEVTGPESAEKAARVLIERGVSCVIVTMGAEGAMLVTPSEARHFPAHRVKAVDATAAGDAFTGALAFGLSRGDSIEDAIELANGVAAFAVTRMGAQTSMPSQADVKTFVEDSEAVPVEQRP